MHLPVLYLCQADDASGFAMFSLLSYAFGKRFLCPGLCCPLLWNHFRFSIWGLVLSYAFRSFFSSVIAKALPLRLRTLCLTHMLLWLSCHAVVPVLLLVAIVSVLVCVWSSWDLLLV